MGMKADDDVSVSIHSVDGPWTPNASRTWGNDVVEKRSKSWNWAWTWGFRNKWSSVCRTTEQVVTPVICSTGDIIRPRLSATWSFTRCNVWPFVLQVLRAKKQLLALLLFSCFGVVPMTLLGYYTPRPGMPPGTWPPYYGVFAAKTLSCGNYIDYRPANSTVTGIEGLFVLDQIWGRLSFSSVKTIDVAWDVLIGRGVQLLAWWVAYTVFSDALLRVIERHPASFRIFQRIALEGPSLLSLWTLCTELLSVKSKRTKSLFVYMLLATSYVLCIPMFLGAMTGYDSTSIAWMDLDDSNNIVPTSAVKYSWVITGTANSTFDQEVCVSSDGWLIQNDYYNSRVQYCTCQMSNGTLAPPDTFIFLSRTGLVKKGDAKEERTTCLFNYQGSEGTWKGYGYDPQTGYEWEPTMHNCNETVTYKLHEQTYDIQNLYGDTAYCYGSRSYDLMELQGKSRCLPDTANPSYQWGFSTMLSGIFVFLHFLWCVTMYIVWLDAQFRSTLVQEGYEMTPLRAAFAIAKAAKHKTGLEEKQLVRHDTKDLNKELYGKGKTKGTMVDYSIFVSNHKEKPENDKEIRRRRALALDGLPS